jgi:hypothetical protein
MSRRLIIIALAAALAALGTLASAGGAQARHGLQTGFSDPQAFQFLDAAQREAAFKNLRSTGGSVVRLLTGWRQIAPVEPPTAADARNPAWSGYRWEDTDRMVREARAAGITVLLSLTAAPDWAEGPGRSADAPPGSWRPSAPAYRLFAEAVARRYSGSFADAAGATLPRVRYYQPWNEPNLPDFVNPQWTRSGGRYKPASPGIYKGLLNAFYHGAKKVRRSNVIVSAGTAPFGETQRGQRRMQAALFTRELLCVTGRPHPRAKRRCPGGPVYFDALAHHPYPIGEPRRTAINADDVVVPDIWKLTRPMKVALRAGHLKPRRHKAVWATEISWDTSPPDPEGLPAKLVARYINGALYTLWRQDVSVVTWWLMRDEPFDARGWGYSLQAGVFFRGATVADDTRKPGFYAFRFPFTAYTKSGVAQVWGLAPRGGPVTIQRRRGGGWRTIARLRTSPGRMFFRPMRLPAGAPLRALQGGETSMTWRVGPNQIERR